MAASNAIGPVDGRQLVDQVLTLWSFGYLGQCGGGGLVCGQESFQFQLGYRDVDRGGEAGDD
jgi:hypothetical protein